MRFAIVIERAEGNYSAYATGDTLQDVEAEIRAAIEFHLEGMREDGLEVPMPQSKVEYIEVAA
jgi:predicted RNase H-like HicB family nuclease